MKPKRFKLGSLKTRRKKPKRSHKTVASLKRKLWPIFSQYRRLLFADSKGMVECVTCQTVRHWQDDMQAGHFIDSRCNSVLFEEQLVYPQCKRCNIFLNGNKVAYTLFMLRKGYTTDDLRRFFDLKNQVRKFTVPELERMIVKYKKKLRILKGE